MWDGGHRQASILPNKKVMWLRFKIFVGYITLITLLAFTVYSFRKEQMERNRLRQDERELIHTRHLAEQIYAALLELSALGETVGVWKEADLSTYQRKSKEAYHAWIRFVSCWNKKNNCLILSCGRSSVYRKWGKSLTVKYPLLSLMCKRRQNLSLSPPQRIRYGKVPGLRVSGPDC